MNKLSKMFLFILGIISSTTIAQNADSIIVIYKNQQTILPVPAYKSQSSISYSDSIRIIEIGVSQRKPEDASLFPQHAPDFLTTGKHRSTSKWFSQIEAGYIKGFSEYEDESSFTRYDISIPATLTTHSTLNDLYGYQIRLLLHEREYYLDRKKSFVSGFIIGYGQNFLRGKQIFTYDDTTDYPPYITEKNYKFRVNSIQFMYKFGLSYQITSWKLPAKMLLGNYLGFSVVRIIDKNDKLIPGYSHINSTLLQPYLGLEISKIGILFSVDFNVPNNKHNIVFDKDIGGNIGLSLTYNIF